MHGSKGRSPSPATVGPRSILQPAGAGPFGRWPFRHSFRFVDVGSEPRNGWGPL